MFSQNIPNFALYPWQEYLHGPMKFFWHWHALRLWFCMGLLETIHLKPLQINQRMQAFLTASLAPFESVVGFLDSINAALSGDGDFVDIAVPDCCGVVTSIDKECFYFLFPATSSAPSIIEGICDIIGRKKVAHHLRQNEAYKFP